MGAHFPGLAPAPFSTGLCPVVLFSDGSPRGCGCSFPLRDCIGRMSDVLIMHRLGAVVSRLAGAVREIEMDLRIPLYLSDTSPLTRRGDRCGGVT